MATLKRHGKIEGGVLSIVADEPMDGGDWRALDDVYPDAEPGEGERLHGPQITITAGLVTRTWANGPLTADELAEVRAKAVAAKVRDIEDERDRRMVLDFAWDFGGVQAERLGATAPAGIRLLQCRPLDWLPWTAAHSSASLMVASGQSGAVFPLRTLDDWEIQATAEQAAAALSALFSRQARLRLHAGKLKDAARVDGADLDAINAVAGTAPGVTGDWPT